MLQTIFTILRYALCAFIVFVAWRVDVVLTDLYHEYETGTPKRRKIELLNIVQILTALVASGIIFNMH